MNPRDLYVLLVFASVPLLGVLDWLIRQLAPSWKRKPPSQRPPFWAAWFAFELWDHAAQHASRFSPPGRFKFIIFIGWLLVVLVGYARITDQPLRKVLWDPPERDSGIVTLGLTRRNDPSR